MKFVVVEQDRPVVHFQVVLDQGVLEIITNYEVRGSTLTLREFHCDGLRPGALNRAGLNAVARELMELANVQNLIVYGAVRSTGPLKGRRQRPKRFRR